MRRIKTYLINLEDRTDRRKHILKEFENRSEFEIELVKAIRHEVGSWGLWLTIKSIISQSLDLQENYIIICEDDHRFTEHYDYKSLIRILDKLRNWNADVLLGGVSWFEDALPLNDELFWIKKFNGLQFVVIFKEFYVKLLEMDFKMGMNADIEMSIISDKCFVCYPFISVQKEFGYSDVTPRNGNLGYVDHLFADKIESLHQLRKIASHYKVIK